SYCVNKSFIINSMLLDSSSFISWVKSHSGLQGNELADKLVKQGSQLKGPCPYSNQYFQLFQEKIIKSFQNFPTKIWKKFTAE
ncbi:MAG: RNase H family protein, partial [bacterium]